MNGEPRNNYLMNGELWDNYLLMNGEPRDNYLMNGEFWDNYFMMNGELRDNFCCWKVNLEIRGEILDNY